VAAREAVAADAAAVAGLLTELGYPQSADRVRGRVSWWRPDESNAVFVWDARGDVLGVVAVHVLPLFEVDGQLGRVLTLVVSDRAQGQGIGAALMAAAETFARDRGAVVMEVMSSRHRADAHAFYRRLGYVDRCGQSGCFLRELD
jgi:GNAT superfamily N-acetyltransferase